MSLIKEHTVATFRRGQHKAAAWQVHRGHKMVHISSAMAHSDTVIALQVPKGMPLDDLMPDAQSRFVAPIVLAIDPDHIDIIK